MFAPRAPTLQCWRILLQVSSQRSNIEERVQGSCEPRLNQGMVYYDYIVALPKNALGFEQTLASYKSACGVFYTCSGEEQ